MKFIGVNCRNNKDMIVMAVKTAVKTHKIELDAMEMDYFEEFLEDYGDDIAKYVGD